MSDIKVDLSSMSGFEETISVKLRDVKNKDAVENLQQLTRNLNRDHYSKQKVRAIVMERIRMLEGVCDIYIENDEDKLFAIAYEELEVLRGLL